MTEGRAVPGDVVVVPDVVGMIVDDARDLARAHGVALAPSDADGPPLGALTWQQPVVVTSQDPLPGTPLLLWHTVVVTWSPRNDLAGDREPRRPHPPHLPDGARELPRD